MLFGFGDGGGGPTREMMEHIHRFHDLEGVSRVTIEPPDTFFREAREQMEANAGEEMPVFKGELYLELHRGTLTSQQDMKRGCRQEESLLRTVEYLGAAASIADAGYAYPTAEMDRIWTTLLLNQFHDILPGSGISWVHREAREDYRRDLKALGRNRRGGLRRPAPFESGRRPAARGGHQPVPGGRPGVDAAARPRATASRCAWIARNEA